MVSEEAGPDASVICWVVENLLSGDCAVREEIVNFVISQAGAEATAWGAPLSDRFIAKLYRILREEVVVSVTDHFEARLFALCAEAQREATAQNCGWIQDGF